MTVGELKEALENVSDNVNVSILIDSYVSERRAPWMAHHDISIEDNGDETEYFTINC